MEVLHVAGYGDILDHFLRGVAFIFGGSFGDFRVLAKIFLLIKPYRCYICHHKAGGLLQSHQVLHHCHHHLGFIHAGEDHCCNT